jgi:hypothetical protein
VSPDLIVSADGPLSVQCGTCKAFIGGTTYPVTEIHLRVLEQLRRSHAQYCGKAATS